MHSKPTIRRRYLTGAVALLMLAATLSACGSGGDGDGKTTLRYQSSAGTVDVLQLAAALNYLPDIKLKKLGDVTGGPQALQALVSRQVDIATNPFLGATAQLVATGAPIKALVATYGSSGDIYGAVAVMQDSPVTSARELIGKKIAVNTLGANSEAILDTWFQREGLSPAEIKSITLVALPPLNTEEALRNHQIDAAYLGQSSLHSAQQRGGLRELVRDVDVVGPYTGGGAVMREDFLAKNAAAATQIVTGIAKAVDYIEQHSRDDVLALYGAWMRDNGYGSYLEAVEANWAGSTGIPTPHAAIRDQDISLWLDWLGSRGDVDPSKIAPANVYSNQYNSEAAT